MSLSEHRGMRIDPATNVIVGVNFICSPNHDDRPENTVIDLLVIHNISLPPGSFGHGYIEDLFLNKLDAGKHPYFTEIKDLKVSSHLLIERTGKLTQFVP
ncbi:MAG: 1,6-anhydro-N-acetylmuramyl-L-alanine amidase AmpD, partial [Pseudomonadota bacterium]